MDTADSPAPQAQNTHLARNILLGIAAVIVVAVAAVATVAVPVMKVFMAHEEIDLDPMLRVFLGAGGNSIILRSPDNDSILVVDTKMGEGAKMLRAYVDSVAPNAEITVVNTHFHSDHAEGNKLFTDVRVISGDYDDQEWVKSSGGVSLPTDELAAGEELMLTIGDETVIVRNMGRAHSWNDVTVYLKNRKLLMTGDLLFSGWHPVIIEWAGASVSSWRAALEEILDTYEIETVIPGHGPMGEEQALTRMRDYFRDAEKAVNNPSLHEQLKAKYGDYFEVPFFSGFDKTVKVLKKESAG